MPQFLHHLSIAPCAADKTGSLKMSPLTSSVPQCTPCHEKTAVEAAIPQTRPEGTHSLRNLSIFGALGQGAGGKVKPIPEEEDFARLRRGGGEDADLALAIRLQEEEILTDHGRNAAVRADRHAPQHAFPPFAPAAAVL